jgi:glycosyltransferase involved in cell wall biosynthesis
MEIAGGIAALAVGTPLVMTERSSEKAYPRSFKWLVRRYVGRYASAIVSNSNQGDTYWQARAHPRTPRFVIPNAIPLDEILATEPATNLNVPAVRRFVLYAGRLDPGKDIDTLLEALQRALAEDEFDVIFCGEGPLRASVQKWITRYDYSCRVTHVGYTPDLWRLMKRATALVTPSLFEGSPNVVLEAMACRCPLILSDIPAHRALVDERSAVLVEPRSVAGFADAIRGVLRDQGAARRRADVAFELARRFTPADIARQYLTVYRRVLAAPERHVHHEGV